MFTRTFLQSVDRCNIYGIFKQRILQVHRVRQQTHSEHLRQTDINFEQFKRLLETFLFQY